MIVLLNLAINMSSMKHLWGVISRITQSATSESINDEGVISPNRDRLQSKEITYLIIYGSVSKPCTPGEHQNSW